MNESKTDQAVRMARYDSGQLRIRLRIILMKQREDDSLVDARAFSRRIVRGGALF
jgi:hypothetical protein